MGNVAYASADWYTVPSGGHHDRLIIDTATGQTVAISLGDDEAKANLIAAAPELLQMSLAVLDLVESEGRDTGAGGAFSDLRDAIAKATGNA